MDVEDTQSVGQPVVSREKTAPFLIRTFVKIGSFHRITLFEDGTLPTTDEQQLFTWKDATLREVLTTLRNTAPHVAEYKHPLARFSFRTVYADPSNKGRYASKDIGMVYSRDILGEPGSLTSTAPRLLQDTEPSAREQGEREREERSLDELRFIPGDFLLIAVLLPKNVTLPSEISIKGSGAAAAAVPAGGSNGWRAGSSAVGKTDAGWGRAAGNSGPGLGRGGGHWRGDSNAPGPAGRGGRGSGRGGGDAGRDRDPDRSDSRVPPPRRHDSPPPRGGGSWGDRDRGGRGGRGGNRRSPSRSRSPPRRRRYD
ncbi:hypothetical protein CVT25_003859 [Psilocybe cyanescens]|uniref:Histone deacetylase complex subunit SAP18 n=1 Tax=Psilocybe cyanescens TaxID=93625 RepID=A0A409XPU6_PSICY|nr:hypothetical protein CVT25_003859 [Psilocybe cyanescens]